MPTKKRRVLTIAKKVDIIRRLEDGVKKVDVSREFDLAYSSLISIWANREKILNTFAQNGSKLKRIRKPLRKDLDEALYSWYVQQKNNNKPVNGRLLRNKAKALAKQAGHTDFLCSTGWLDRFKIRHDIAFRRICDKSNSINFDVNKYEFYTLKEEIDIEENYSFDVKSIETEEPQILLKTDENEVYEETVEKSCSPPTFEKSYSPPTVKQSCSPSTVEKLCSPTVKKSCSPPTVEKSCSPPTVEISCSPPTVEKSCSPPTVEKSYSPPTVEISCSPPTVEKSCSPPTVKQSCSPPTVVKSCSPPIVEKSCSPPTVEQYVIENEDINKNNHQNLVRNKEESFDELDYFAKYIIAQLRKMPQCNALMCQEQIQRIIIKEHMAIESNTHNIQASTNNYLKLSIYSPSVSPRLT